MPQVAVAAAAVIGNAVAAVAGTAIGAAVANGVVALGFGSGIVAGISAWATVAGIASLALNRKPKIGGVTDGGTQIDFQANPNAGVPMVVGRTGTGGVIAHINSDGEANKNAHLFFLAILSVGPISGVTGFTANNEAVTFDPAGHAAITSSYTGQMDLTVQLGDKPSPYFLYGAMPDGTLPEWDTDHLLSGLAAAWWDVNYDPAVYSTGVPKPIFIVDGPAVYDPRADDTFPGGEGDQRADDETTWSFTGNDNPFLQGLTFLLGRYASGARTHGLGLPVSAIDVAAFAEGANVCESNGWTCGGVVTSSDKKWDVLVAMLQAGSGAPLRLGGKVSCVVDAPKVSLATITGDDVVGEATITATKARRDRFNRVVPRFRSEANLWEIVDGDPVAVATYITEDGATRTREIEFSLCQDKDQAAQLAAYQIVNAREAEPIVLPLKPKYLGYKGGDCLTVNEPELGLNNQKVLVTDWAFDPATAAPTLTVRTETDAKHAFALGKTGTAPPTPGLTGIDGAFVPAPDLGAWSVTGTVLSSADGDLPALIITGAVDAATVAAIIVDYREVLDVGFGEWASQSFPPTATTLVVTGLKPNTNYQVRIRYRTVRNVDGTGSLDLGQHTVGHVVSYAVKTIGDKTVADYLAEAEAVAAQGDSLVRTVLAHTLQLIDQRDAMIDDAFHNGGKVKRIVVDDTDSFDEDEISVLKRHQLLATVVDGGLAMQLNDTTLKASDTETWGDYKTGLATSLGDNAAAIVTETSARTTADTAIASSVTSLTSTVAGNTAAISSESSTRASADSAISSNITSLTATVSTNTAAIATESTARASGDSANASSISTLSTTVGGHTSSITTLQSSVNGISALYTVVVNSGTSRASIQAYAGGSLSSIIFTAANIGFTNGSSDYFPLSISGGVLRAYSMEIDTIKANSIVVGGISVGAATGAAVYATAPSTVLVVATPVDGAAGSFTVLDGATCNVKVDVRLQVQETGAAPANFIVSLYRGATLVDQGSFQIAAGSVFDFPFPCVDINPSAGSHTYTPTIELASGSATLLRAQTIIAALNKSA